MEFNMLTSTKHVSIAIAVTLALGMRLSPAFSASAPSNTAMQNQAAPALRSGNLVRLRSGGAPDGLPIDFSSIGPVPSPFRAPPLPTPFDFAIFDTPIV